MTTSALEFQSATELSGRLRRRDVSAVELVEASARRYEQHNASVNAVVTPLYDAALERARRADERLSRGGPTPPLHALPLALKDLTETAGVRTTYGSRRFEHYVPAEDAVLARRLEEAG